MLVWRYIPTIVWLVAVFGACDLSLRMVVHYTNAMLYLLPFIVVWGLPPPVERCIPALVVYLYLAMFGIAQGAPTPGCMPGAGDVSIHRHVCCRGSNANACPRVEPPTVSSAPSEGVQRAVLTKQQGANQGQTRGPLQPKNPPHGK